MSKDKPKLKDGGKKRDKPTVGKTKEPKAVKPKEKKKRERITPPGAPVLVVDGITSPLLQSTRNKRPLCVALANLISDDTLLCRAVRESGILLQKGLTPSNINGTELLKGNELSGMGYAMRTGRAMQKEYTAKYPNKVEACMPFAKAFVAKLKANGSEEWEQVRTTATANLEHVKIERPKKHKKVKKDKSAKAKDGKSKKTKAA